MGMFMHVMHEAYKIHYAQLYSYAMSLYEHKILNEFSGVIRGFVKNKKKTKKKKKKNKNK